MFIFDPRMKKDQPHGCKNCVLRNDMFFGANNCWYPNIGCNTGTACYQDNTSLKPASCPWIDRES